MIFYFSATGNSKHLADFIANETNEKTVNITAAMRESAFNYELSNDESLGFVFPVFFSGVPSAVLDFVSALNLNGTPAYTFTALTCGGGTGGSNKMFAAALAQKGLSNNAVFCLKTVDNYIPMFKIVSADEAKTILNKTIPKIKYIARQVATRQKGDFDDLKGSAASAKIMYAMYKPMSKTKKFFAEDACVGCGKCADECVNNAIEMKNGKPTWVKPVCTGCFHCLHSCPKEAIQFGKSTKKRNRYMNPYAN